MSNIIIIIILTIHRQLYEASLGEIKRVQNKTCKLITFEIIIPKVVKLSLFRGQNFFCPPKEVFQVILELQNSKSLFLKLSSSFFKHSTFKQFYIQVFLFFPRCYHLNLDQFYLTHLKYFNFSQF